MAEPRFRTTRSGTVDVGLLYDRVWRFHFDGEPLDLLQYDGGISMIVFDDADLKVDEYTVTVDAETNDDSSGTPVRNVGTFTMAPTAAADGYFAHIVGIKSSQPYQIGKPIEMTHFAGPPIT